MMVAGSFSARRKWEKEKYECFSVSSHKAKIIRIFFLFFSKLHVWVGQNEKLVDCEGGQMSFGPIILMVYLLLPVRENQMMCRGFCFSFLLPVVRILIFTPHSRVRLITSHKPLVFLFGYRLRVCFVPRNRRIFCQQFSCVSLIIALPAAAAHVSLSLSCVIRYAWVKLWLKVIFFFSFCFSRASPPVREWEIPFHVRLKWY